MSGKQWRSLVSATLAGLLPSVARADSRAVAPAGVILPFGTPRLVPPAPEPPSDPPALDLQFAVAAGTTEGARKWNGVPFDSGGLVVPVLGPWVTLGSFKPNCGGLYNDEPVGCTRVHTQDAWRTILIVDGLVQLLGVTLITVGLALPREELVIADTVKARVVPMPLGSSSHGLALTGSF